ncbi:MAG: lipid II flippase MurJ [Candidatus Dojkabacteria bacterium]|nr:lipid II flippase MurJ [Candidatus Dojkabacteria bacterium]
MRALLFPQLFLGISVFVSSGLNIYDRYIVPQLSPLFYNIGRIIIVVSFLPLFDYSPWVIVLGAYLGSLLHLLVQLPLFKNLKIKYLPIIDFKDNNLKEVLKLGLPRILVTSL